jgi:hypothetical protein
MGENMIEPACTAISEAADKQDLNTIYWDVYEIRHHPDLVHVRPHEHDEFFDLLLRVMALPPLLTLDESWFLVLDESWEWTRVGRDD